MRIAFDLDEVVFKKSTIFCAMARGLKDAGHEIGVLSARKEPFRYNTLCELEAVGFPEPDFLIMKTEQEEEYFKRPWKNGLWKALKCEEENIDMLIDDFDGNNEGYIWAFQVLQPGKLILVCT